MIGKTNAISGVSAPVPKIKTVSGSVISISDALAQAAESLVVGIEPVQSGSGDPSPSNVRPISGWSAVNVTRTGKNLLPTAGYANTTRTALNSSMCAEVAEIVVGKSDSFVISGKTTAVQSDANFITFYFEYTDGTNSPTIIYRGDQHSSGAITGAWSAVSTSGKIISSVRLGGNTGSATVTLSELQLELGSTATAYEPYNGNTYTIQLGQTVYGGSLDVTNGVMTVDKAIVDLGTLNWSYFTNNKRFVVTRSDGKPTGTGKGGYGICSSYPVSQDNYGALADKTLSVGSNFISGSTCSIVVHDESYTDATAFKTAMNGVQLVYELATPQTVQLSPTTVQMLLGNNVLWADSGDSELQYWARR